MAMAATARKFRSRVSSQAAVAPTETMTGKITRIVFHNPENGYAVIRFCPEGANVFEEITAVGYFPNLRQSDEYKLLGSWTEHSRFGRQLIVSEYELLIPSTREGIVSYLAATVPGIGPVRAAKIADALGDDALEVIKREPDRLRNIPGITPEQVEQIIAKVKANETLAELSALICGDGITPNLAAKICAKYGGEAVAKVKENPYILADELRGIGFVTADKIARGIGIAPDAPFRVQAAILYLLNVAGEEGHVYLRPSEIVAQLPEITGAMAGITTPQIAAAVEELIRLNKAVREDNRIYLVERWKAEVELAEGMRRLLNQGGREVPDWAIGHAEELAGITYADSQKAALEMALASPLSIVTGGPGTGKSTILRGLVADYERLNAGEEKPIHLAAPTGRAAKRITETTGREASTIHRLLAYHPEYGFQYNADNPLPAGLLIVDEFSMADLDLANALFSALPPNMQVVLVGDIDQLPSVGPGSVLRDAIDSGVVPTTRLEYNYRQAAGSTIALYAHQICQGQTPDLAAKTADFVAYEADEAEDAVKLTLKMVEQALAEGYTASDFQILTPMRKTPTGVTALNHLIREMVNPPAEGRAEVKYGGTIFRAGDKVMQVRNNYKKGVFNGDLGFVTDIVQGSGSKVTVKFDETAAEYEYSDLGELELAYASTVHKSQGSEFPLVICLCLRQHFILLQRNLLYTGITRAKHKLILIHQPRAGKKAGAVEIAIKNNLIQARNSYLAERLKG